MITLAGIDWRATFAAIPAAATANAIAMAWSPITGRPPAVVREGDYYRIVFDETQEDRAAAWIVTQLNREPGPVRMEIGGVAMKVIGRKYWPWIAGAVAVGAALGYVAGRK